jgi:hypothetical protein
MFSEHIKDTRMKNFFTLIFSLAFVTYSLSQVYNKPPKALNSDGKGPVIRFIEQNHDFGNITEGSYAKWVFKFYNTGDKPLILKSVNTSCGCTAPTWPKQPVMPGDSSAVSAVFNSRGYGGINFQKSITVTTNMEVDGVFVLSIKGHVTRTDNQPENPAQSPVQINNH